MVLSEPLKIQFASLNEISDMRRLQRKAYAPASRHCWSHWPDSLCLRSLLQKIPYDTIHNNQCHWSCLGLQKSRFCQLCFQLRCQALECSLTQSNSCATSAALQPPSSEGKNRFCTPSGVRQALDSGFMVEAETSCVALMLRWFSFIRKQRRAHRTRSRWSRKHDAQANNQTKGRVRVNQGKKVIGPSMTNRLTLFVGCP